MGRRSLTYLQWMGLGFLDAIVLSFAGMIVHAGGWAHVQLQYGVVSQVFHNQTQEFDDRREQTPDRQDNSHIDLTQQLNDEPPKDGVPSIDGPKFDTVMATPFPGGEPVLGVEINGEAVAYPVGILNWHEIVNDTVGGVNVSVTYCPLRDTGMVFDRGDTTFGVSGKLYPSCLVLYDRRDDSLFVQPWGIGILGAQENRVLSRRPVVQTTLEAWAHLHPDTKILSADTGYSRDYFHYPYGTHQPGDRFIFSIRNQDV